jgi:transcription elongation GreA/GreB family factor
MPDNATQTTHKPRSWPLTSRALRQLIDEVARLRQDLSSLTSQGLEEGIIQLPVAVAARRIEVLTDVLERAELVDDRPCAAIGRRATLRDDDGQPMSFEIVVPGGGDPDKGRISADSPLGGAVLGAQAGDVIEVSAPAGRWSVTVTSIDP